MTSESPGAPPRTAGVPRYSIEQVQRAQAVLSAIYAARRSARFYPLDHPACKEAVRTLARGLGEYHQEGVDLHLAFHEGEVLLGEQLLADESLLFDQLVRDMTALGVGTLVIRRGVTDDELLRLLAVLISESSEVEAAGGVTALAEKSRLPSVEIRSLAAVERMDTASGEPGEEAKAAYGDAVSLLRDVDRLLRVDRTVPAQRVKGAVRSLVDNVLTNRGAMLQLAGLKDYDEYTFYHSANVSVLALALGSAVTTDYRFLSALATGAVLHDIGKLSIEHDVLNKPGVLDADEWELMRRHPVVGAQMAARMPGIDRAAIVTILEHHTRYDASGYPELVPRRPQHLASRIVAVADSYDAMTSKRSYSAARVQDEAMVKLSEAAGSSLDPTLVRLFIGVVGVYPPRSVVRLSSGHTGVVLEPNATDPRRPVVRVVANEAGEIVDPFDLSLASEREVGIECCLDPSLLNIDADDYI